MGNPLKLPPGFRLRNALNGTLVGPLPATADNPSRRFRFPVPACHPARSKVAERTAQVLVVCAARA